MPCTLWNWWSRYDVGKILKPEAPKRFSTSYPDHLILLVHVSSRRAYQFSQIHMCKIHVSVCIMYVWCMYVFFCMYLVCIMYVQVCVCMACIGPTKCSYHHNLAKWPASGPATRRPYSGQRWAGAHLLCSAIQDNMSDPIWRTAARSTRRGGPTRVRGVTNRPPMCINTSAIPS